MFDGKQSSSDHGRTGSSGAYQQIPLSDFSSSSGTSLYPPSSSRRRASGNSLAFLARRHWVPLLLVGVASILLVRWNSDVYFYDGEGVMAAAEDVISEKASNAAAGVGGGGGWGSVLKEEWYETVERVSDKWHDASSSWNGDAKGTGGTGNKNVDANPALEDVGTADEQEGEDDEQGVDVLAQAGKALENAKGTEEDREATGSSKVESGRINGQDEEQDEEAAGPVAVSKEDKLLELEGSGKTSDAANKLLEDGDDEDDDQATSPKAQPLSHVPHLIDDEDCGAPSCRFLLPQRIREQETKGANHLYQLGVLALVLNRTLVLPRADQSYFGACHGHPFSYFYDDTYYASLGLPTISQERFQTYLNSRRTKTSAQEITMVISKSEQEALTIAKSVNTTYPEPMFCFAKEARLDFSGHRSVNFTYRNPREQQSDALDSFLFSLMNGVGAVPIPSKSAPLNPGGAPKSPSALSDSISSTAIDSTMTDILPIPDVFIMTYDLRRPIFSSASFNQIAKSLSLPTSIQAPKPYLHLPYAQTWQDLTSQIVKRLSPFIVVQWRTETVTPGNLGPCATTLVKKLRELKAKWPEVKSVYVATDYPLENLRTEVEAEKEARKRVPDGRNFSVAAEPGLNPIGGDSSTSSVSKLLPNSPPTPADSSSLLPRADRAHSITYTLYLTDEHHAAMRKFLKEFDEADLGLTLTSYADEEPTLKLPEGRKSLKEIDYALIGMVDKSVAMRAELLLAGEPGRKYGGGCARGTSSYAASIVTWREQPALQKSGLLWNTVDRFKLPPGVGVQRM